MLHALFHAICCYSFKCIQFTLPLRTRESHSINQPLGYTGTERVKMNAPGLLHFRMFYHNIKVMRSQVTLTIQGPFLHPTSCCNMSKMLYRFELCQCPGSSAEVSPIKFLSDWKNLCNILPPMIICKILRCFTSCYIKTAPRIRCIHLLCGMMESTPHIHHTLLYINTKQIYCYKHLLFSSSAVFILYLCYVKQPVSRVVIKQENSFQLLDFREILVVMCFVI